MIRVLIVDPVRLMCHVLRAVLEDEIDIEVIGCATSVEEALLQVGRADVHLVSASSNEAELELIERITMLNPSAKVLAIGLPADKDVILRHLEAGAAGYVLSEDSLERLLDSVRAVWQRAAYVSPEVAAALIARLTELHIRCDRDGDTLVVGADLSPREREVLELVRQGHTNREIADRLTIELGTVKNHMHNVLRKLNVKTRREAAHVFG
jgi:two-component system, NarL family, nitrate/nitrite response regulator NarL